MVKKQKKGKITKKNGKITKKWYKIAKKLKHVIKIFVRWKQRKKYIC